MGLQDYCTMALEDDLKVRGSGGGLGGGVTARPLLNALCHLRPAFLSYPLPPLFFPLYPLHPRL